MAVKWPIAALAGDEPEDQETKGKGEMPAEVKVTVCAESASPTGRLVTSTYEEGTDNTIMHHIWVCLANTSQKPEDSGKEGSGVDGATQRAACHRPMQTPSTCIAAAKRGFLSTDRSAHAPGSSKNSYDVHSFHFWRIFRGNGT